jgi:hypothetical protein
VHCGVLKVYVPVSVINETGVIFENKVRVPDDTDVFANVNLVYPTRLTCPNMEGPPPPADQANKSAVNAFNPVTDTG